MRLSFELARRGYRRYAAYPGAMVAGLFTNVVFGFLIAYILLAVYDETVSIGGYDVEDAIAYVWISQGLLSVAGIFGPSWWELARRVQTGDVATDLQRPRRHPARGPRRRTSVAPCTSCVWRAVPQFVLGALLFELTIPDEAGRWLALRAQRRARRLRQLRDPLPRQPLHVLAARLPRPDADRHRDQPRALGCGDPARLLPGAASTRSCASRRSRRFSRRRSTSTSAILSVAASRWCSRSSSSGRSCSTPPGNTCCRRHAQAGAAGWLSWRRIYVRLVGARLRAQLEYRLSAALQLVGADSSPPRLRRDRRDLRERPAARRLDVAEVALLYGLATISFCAHRRRDRAPRPASRR